MVEKACRICAWSKPDLSLMLETGGMRVLTGLFIGLLSVAAVAQSPQQIEREKRQFQERAKTLGDDVSADDPNLSARCRALRQEVQLYRGKPQRGFTARRNYEAECMRDNLNPGEFSSDPSNSAIAR